MTEQLPGEPSKEPVSFTALFPGIAVGGCATPIVAVGLVLLIAALLGGSSGVRWFAALLVVAAWAGLVYLIYQRSRTFGLGMVLGSVIGVIIFGSCVVLIT